MFANVDETKTITGKNVDEGLVQRAQFVIEAYVGKMEEDVTDLKDLEILKRATAYQAAYMVNNEDMVFEQMMVSTSGINDSYTTFKQDDEYSPFISPMARMVCKKLSFLRGRSVKTGKTIQRIPLVLNWRQSYGD